VGMRVYKCTRVLCVCMRVYNVQECCECVCVYARIIILISDAMHPRGSEYRCVIAFLPARRAGFCRVSYARFCRSAVRRLNRSALTVSLTRIDFAVILPGWIFGFWKASRR